MAGHPSPIVIAGALAYDQIGQTTNIVHDESGPLHAKLDDLYEAFGGCAGNVAYNLALLGQPPRVISCLGSRDGERYLDHFTHLKIDLAHIVITPDASSARAFIISEPNGHQFTAFYPGELPSTTEWVRHIDQIDFAPHRLFAQLPLPFAHMHAALEQVKSRAPHMVTVVCPGQYCEMCTHSELAALCACADLLVANAVEAARLNPIRQTLPADTRPDIVITNGPQPVRIESATQTYEVAVAPSNPTEGVNTVDQEDLDPTGCGDAFIAGLMHAANKQIEPQPSSATPPSGAVDKNRAALMAALTAPSSVAAGIAQVQLALGCVGGQNHSAGL